MPDDKLYVLSIKLIRRTNFNQHLQAVNAGLMVALFLLMIWFGRG